MKEEYLFVYGTLKRNIKNSKNDLLKKYASFVGEGFVYGKLYKVSYYPGAVLDDKRKHKIYGEIYKLKDPVSAFKVLDRYEECGEEFKEPWEYRRVKTKAFLKDGEMEVWIYEFQEEVKECDRIESGVFTVL